MGTNNYKWDNILIAIPYFDFIEHGYNEFIYDEYVESIQQQLEKIDFELCDKLENDRYYSHIIARWGLQDNDGMIKWLEVVVRAGYYNGANIDYIIDGDFGIESEQNSRYIAHYEAMNRKFNKQVSKLEKILRANGKELQQIGTMSNGEGVYKLKK